MFCGGDGEGLMLEQRALGHMMDLGNTQHMPVSMSAPYGVYPSGNGNGNAAIIMVLPHDESSSNPLNPQNPINPRNPMEAASAPLPTKVLRYRECQRNHAANIGGHALDGCGEFMPAEDDTLKCAACGCHRNFHRREVEGDEQPPSNCECCLRKKRGGGSSSGPGSPAAPYYPLPLPHGSSAPHMLMALSSGLTESDDPDGNTHNNSNNNNLSHHHHRGMKKRFRTKFSQDQKEKMHLFAEKMGWRMQKQDEAIVQQFCNEIGVGKGVLKVWMHNNKHTLGSQRYSSLLRSWCVNYSSKAIVSAIRAHLCSGTLICDEHNSGWSSFLSCQTARIANAFISTGMLCNLSDLNLYNQFVRCVCLQKNHMDL